MHPLRVDPRNYQKHKREEKEGGGGEVFDCKHLWSMLFCLFMILFAFLTCIFYQAVQEYKHRQMAPTSVSPSSDVVVITKADLEGYHSACDDDTNNSAPFVRKVCV